MAQNPFSGGVNPPDLYGGQSQMGSLSGQRNSRLTDPLIRLRGGELSRVTFAGGQLIDPFNVWTKVGAPGIGGLLTGKGIREGSVFDGGVSYWQMGSGADPLDFDGDFSLAIIVDGSGLDATSRRIFGNADYSTAGYSVYANNVGTGVSYYPGPGAIAAPALLVGIPNIICVGRSGGSVFIKVNLSGIGTGVISSWVPATNTAAVIGALRPPGGANGTFCTVYEMWAATQPASDALFTTIANEVKTNLGITAW